ncbi:hypothetical protein RQP46_000879 [Phenoliferia psychrophenolica]
MPPKKKARTLEPWASLDSDLAAQFGPAELTADHLKRAYGLAGPLDDDDEADPYRLCSAKWLEDAPPKAAGPAPVDVIVIDDDESEEDNKQPTLKSKAKGKGKAKDKATVCSAENCQRNPRCLNWLGQSKWEDTEKAFESFKKAASVGEDPSNARVDDLPVGLRNLGATCYVNSYLQVWFQDVTFRSGVYACLPPANGDVESSPLFQLQVLFTFLQSSKQAVYDPEALVTALKLDKTEQQDSAEFSKLFMHLLDSEFKKQAARAAKEALGDVAVGDLVSRQFEGDKVYGTQCDTCHTLSERSEKFFELEINLTKDCLLEDCIRTSLAEETLDEDNQYSCGRCEKMRDATRFCTLTSIPPVLHFSLLRFQYNLKEQARKKSQFAISYPLALDMGEFLPKDPNGRQPQVWYDLKGVLMHKGTSAHHGHYVAQVHDGSKGKWYLFDDETVTSIEDLNAPSAYDNENEDEQPKKQAKGKKKTDFPRTASGEILPRSKDAYMLVYTRREPLPTAAAEPAPPALALSRVDDLDQKHQDEVVEYNAKAAAVLADFEMARDAKRSVYRNWNVLEEDEDTFLVSKVSLREWLEGGLKPTKGKKDETPAKQSTPENVSSASPHPDQKPVDEESAAAAVDIVPESPKSERDSKAEDSEMAVDDTDLSITPTVVADGGSPDLGDVYAANANVLSNVDVICPHNFLDPKKASAVKVISQIGVITLRDLGVSIEPELIVRRDLCRQCVWGIAADHHYEETHPTQADLLKQKAGPGAIWISARWLKDWCKPKPSMHDAGTLTDPAPDADEWAGDILCNHGSLQPDPSKRKLISIEAASMLQDIFPDWQPRKQNEKVCSKCAKSHERDEKSRDEANSHMKKEKATFKSFDNQSTLSGGGLYIEVDARFLVPRPWSTAWTRWSKKHNDSPRPGDLDNNELLCKPHGKLLLDLDQEMDKPVSVVTVSPKEWDLLQTSYAAGPPLSIWQDRRADHPSTSIAVCEECVDLKRKSFSEATIMVKVLSASDISESGERKPARSPSSELEVYESPSDKKRPSNSSNSITYGTRKSKRILAKPAWEAKKKNKPIDMYKSDTVKDLKIRIQEILDIPTIYQRLWYNNQELESDDTVEALGLHNGAVIEVLEVKVDDDVDLGQLDDSVPNANRKRKNREEGFGGTGLFGWEKEADVADKMDVEEAAPVASGSKIGGRRGAKAGGATTASAKPAPKPSNWHCSHCTFSQEGDGEECELCGLPR